MCTRVHENLEEDLRIFFQLLHKNHIVTEFLTAAQVIKRIQTFLIAKSYFDCSVILTQCMHYTKNRVVAAFIIRKQVFHELILFEQFDSYFLSSFSSQVQPRWETFVASHFLDRVAVLGLKKMSW